MPTDRSEDRHKTPRRIISASDELWSDFGALCAEEDTNRSADLKAYMVRRVKRWKAAKAKAAE
jgi:hypothetical protein